MFSNNEIFLRKLIFIGNFFLTSPPFIVGKSGSSLFYTFLSTLYIPTTTAILVWSTMRKGQISNHSNSAYFEPIVVFLEHISQVVVHISFTICVVRMTFLKRKSYQQFLQKIFQINKILHSSWKESNKLFYGFLLYLILILLTIGYDAYLWINVLGWKGYTCYLLRIVQSIQIFIHTFMLFSFLQCIKFQYAAITEKLLEESKSQEHKINSTQGQGDISRFNSAHSVKRTRSIQEVTDIHDEICNCADSFNSIFGFNILLIVISSFTNILLQASLFAIFARYDDFDRGDKFGMDLMGSRLAWIVVSLMLPIVLAYASTGAVEEARKIVPTCLSYSNKLAFPKTNEDQVKKDGLAALCHQAESRVPQFSAGGFFQVDYTMIGMIFSNITADIIVVLQFYHSEKIN